MKGDTMRQGWNAFQSGRVEMSFLTFATSIIVLVGLAAAPALAVKRADPLPLGKIPPGHAYRTTVMTPEVTFTLPKKAKGWQEPLPELTDTFFVNKGGNDDGTGALASFTVIRLTSVLVDPLTPDPVEGTAAEPAPADMVGWLQANPNLTVSPPTTRTIAGVQANVVDITTNIPAGAGGGTCATSANPADTPCVTLIRLENPAAYFAIPHDTKQMWAFFTVGTTPIAVEWDVATTDPKAAADAKTLDQIVASIKIAAG